MQRARQIPSEAWHCMPRRAVLYHKESPPEAFIFECLVALARRLDCLHKVFDSGMATSCLMPLANRWRPAPHALSRNSRTYQSIPQDRTSAQRVETTTRCRQLDLELKCRAWILRKWHHLALRTRRHQVSLCPRQHHLGIWIRTRFYSMKRFTCMRKDGVITSSLECRSRR